MTPQKFCYVWRCFCSPNLIFWTNWNPNDPSIYRASISGNNLTKIISSNIHKPNGLTIDPIVKHIYWVDATLDKIERSNFEGLNRKASLFIYFFFYVVRLNCLVFAPPAFIDKLL